MKEGVGDPHKANTFLSPHFKQHCLFVRVMCKDTRREWKESIGAVGGGLPTDTTSVSSLQTKKLRLRGASLAQDRVMFLRIHSLVSGPAGLALSCSPASVENQAGHCMDHRCIDEYYIGLEPSQQTWEHQNFPTPAQAPTLPVTQAPSSQR